MVSRDAWIAVYMMTDHYRGTLYTGVTGQFFTRIVEHREGQTPGFTRRHRLKRLVWYEIHDLMTEAIQRETSQALASAMEDQSDRARQSPLGRSLRVRL